MNAPTLKDIVIRATRDEYFRKQLIADANRTIEREYGVSFPREFRFSVEQNTKLHEHIVLPYIPTPEKHTDDDIWGKVTALTDLLL